jgi:hypothetical protein
VLSLQPGTGDALARRGAYSVLRAYVGVGQYGAPWGMGGRGLKKQGGGLCKGGKGWGVPVSGRGRAALWAP